MPVPKAHGGGGGSFPSLVSLLSALASLRAPLALSLPFPSPSRLAALTPHPTPLPGGMRQQEVHVHSHYLGFQKATHPNPSLSLPPKEGAAEELAELRNPLQALTGSVT